MKLRPSPNSKFDLVRVFATTVFTAGTLFAILASMAGNLAAQSGGVALPSASFVPAVRVAQVNARAALADARKVFDGSVPGEARALLGSVPLAAEPFLYSALADFPTPQSSGTLHAQRLLTEAVRRNPRYRQPRLLLLRQAVIGKDLQGALGQLVILNRLEPQQTSAMLAYVGKNLRKDREIDDVVDVLGAEPELLDQVVTGYLSAEPPVELTIHFGQKLNGTSSVLGLVRERMSAYLAQRGEFQAARRLIANQAGSAPSGLVIDPGFTRTEQTAPFGWDFTESNIGVAEREASGGVFVSYYGRRSGSLLRQLATLPPGRFRLIASMEGTGTTDGAIELFVSCAGSSVDLVSAPVKIGDGKSSKVELWFTVPKGSCEGQYFGLRGNSESGRKTQNVRVSKIDITKGAP